MYVSKGIIWASEYSLGPQIWGPGGARAPPQDPLLLTVAAKFSVTLYHIMPNILCELNFPKHLPGIKIIRH